MMKWMTVLLLICLAGASVAQEYTLTQREFLVGTPASPDVSTYSEYLNAYWSSYIAGEDAIVSPETTTKADIWLANFPLDVSSSSFGGTTTKTKILNATEAGATYGLDKSWIYTTSIMPAYFEIIENVTPMDPTTKNTIFLQQDITRSFSGYPITGKMNASEAAQRNRIYLEQEIYSKFLKGGV